MTIISFEIFITDQTIKLCIKYERLVKGFLDAISEAHQTLLLFCKEILLIKLKYSLKTNH